VSGAGRIAAVAVRRTCERLGPAYVKLGQLASVRPDVFPATLVFELEKLQDAVEPVRVDAIREVFREQFGALPEELFATFDPEPLASASIAQVHRATLREEARPAWGPTMPAGSEVVVKVVRPGAEASVASDVARARSVLRVLARLGVPRRFDAHSLLDEFEASLARELDLRVEGRVADRFRFDFRDDPLVMVPRVAWSLTGRRVLTMERVDGWRLTEIDAATLAGIDARALAEHGATAFMRQVLVHGRYHADLHPANVFVTRDGRIAYLDFGIVGTLGASERESVALLLAALVYRDADRALRASEALGVRVPDGASVALRRDLGELLDAKFGAGGSRDVRGFGMGFLKMLGRHGVRIPAGYGLLVKSLVTVEGVARALYPDIDIVETSGPFVTRLLLRSALRPDRLARRLPYALRAAAREIVA